MNNEICPVCGRELDSKGEVGFCVECHYETIG